MRCPNCGNENPPDYVFCDECGARLGAGDEAAVAAQPAAAGAGANASANDQRQAGDVGLMGAGGLMQQGYDSSQGDQGQAQSSMTPYDGGGQYGAAGGDSGPVGAADLGSDQGGPDAQGSAGAGASSYAGASGNGDYGAGQPAAPVAYGADEAGGAGPTAASGVAAASNYGADQDDGADTPVTEDTVDTGGAGDSDVYASTAQEGQDQGSAMPGVVEIDDQEAQDDQGSYGYAPVASGETYSDAGAGGGAQAAVQDQGAWASQALNLLDDAQAAMGRGDWASFGTGMSELRSFLTSLGGTTSTTAWTAGTSGSYGTSATSTSTQGTAGQSSGYAGGGTSQGGGYGATQQSSGYTGGAYSGGSQTGGGAPTVEPDAEAGTLDAQEDTGYEADYSAQAGGASEPASGDAGNSADAGAGAGMMAPAASQAAVGGGVAGSTNGASENMMARLVIISTGAELPLPDQEEIMVGREDPSSGIFPDVDLTPYGGEEGGVSRRHARLLCINAEYFVEDLQSTNFTKLDGQRLPAHVRERLEDGARIDFGRVATIFRRS